MDSRDSNHYLKCSHPSRTSCSGKQSLGDYCYQIGGYLNPYLFLSFRRESIDYSINSLSCSCSVKCGKNQVPCFCCKKSCFNSSQVSHLSYHHNVRVLSQSSYYSFCKRRNIYTKFPLRNYSSLVFMIILYGIFNSNYVAITVCVYIIYHRCQGSGFSTSRRTCYKHKSPRSIEKFFYLFRKTYLLKSQKFVGNKPHGNTYSSLFTINTHSETSQISKSKPKFCPTHFSYSLLMSRRSNAFHHSLCIFWLKRLVIQHI